MSVETKTTVSDYINAMFKMADNMEQPCEQDERRKVLAAANELKEAWERERAEIAAKAAAEAVMLTNEKWKRDGGNAVMLRMAMENVATGLKEVVGHLSDLETEASVALEHAPDHVENAAALRNALELCLAWYNEETAEGVNVDDVAEKARNALASPPRNCDVGTVEEQKARMADWCHRTHCGDCPSCTEWCALSWANAPYDAAQEGGK